VPGLPDGIFSNQNLPDLSKFLECLARDDVGIFLAILSTLRPNGIFFGHLVHFVVIWYTFPVLVCFLYREKSGNPALRRGRVCQNRIRQTIFWAAGAFTRAVGCQGDQTSF
jgi:hypothetical protein